MYVRTYNSVVTDCIEHSHLLYNKLYNLTIWIVYACEYCTIYHTIKIGILITAYTYTYIYTVINQHCLSNHARHSQLCPLTLSSQSMTASTHLNVVPQWQRRISSNTYTGSSMSSLTPMLSWSVIVNHCWAHTNSQDPPLRASNSSFR